MTLTGAGIRRARAGGDALPGLLAGLPEPDRPDLDEPWDVLVTGIGGTGVVTIGAIIGMAAHLENKGVTVLDQSGLAQKNGAVVSHVRIAAAPENLHAVRIAAGRQGCCWPATR